MNRIFVVILILAVLLFPLTAAAATIPDAADCIAEQMDEQLMTRFNTDDDKQLTRSRFLIMGTTPANINNLEQAMPLGRQMTEEISRWLVNAGYRYEELRKGKDIRFDERTGEFILTRRVPKLARTSGYGNAILAGTYVISGNQVRFTMSLLAPQGNEVLAKGTATVPITPDIMPLLRQNQPAGSGKVPSVYTKLQ